MLKIISEDNIENDLIKIEDIRNYEKLLIR